MYIRWLRRACQDLNVSLIFRNHIDVGRDAAYVTLRKRLASERGAAPGWSNACLSSFTSPVKEVSKWPTRSSELKSLERSLLRPALCAILAFAIGTSAHAEAVMNGPAYGDVKTAISPVTDAVTGLIYFLVVVWQYFITNAGAAVILSAAMAAVFAILSMRHTAITTRIRETFAAINKQNWLCSASV